MTNRTTRVASAVALALGMAALPLAALADNKPEDSGAEIRVQLYGDDGTTGVQAQARARVMASTTLPRMNQVLERARERAENEIERRVNALENFQERIGDAKRISDESKTALSQTMQEQIRNMERLHDEIASSTSTSTIKDVVQSITKSYRIFALVIPQSAIMAAADRANTVATQLMALSEKLAARLAAVTGADTSVPAAALADLDAKVADAVAQAKAAVDAVTALKPDNGDQAVLQANQKALQDARKKLQAAHQSLRDARRDAQTVVQWLHANAAQAAATSEAE